MKELINEVINYLIINKKEVLNNDINDLIYSDFERTDRSYLSKLSFKDLQLINEYREKIYNIYKLIDKLEEIKKDL